MTTSTLTPTEQLWQTFSAEHGLKRWTELKRNPRLFKRFVEALKEQKLAGISAEKD